MKPQIIIEDYQGRHNNSDYERRLKEEGAYKDRSTICIIPTRGMIHAKIVQNWMGMFAPMNQKFVRIFMIGMEVGEAYEAAINMILDSKRDPANPDIPCLNEWQYIFTLEEDNMVPPDCLVKLYKGIDEGYDAVGALYWTKGEGGQPMAYGDPNVVPLNFTPQIPRPECVTRCCGLGMGATLFKMSLFKDGKIERPFFKTIQSYEPGIGTQGFTQDLYFFNKANKYGYRFGCDSRVKVGHYDAQNDIVW